MEPVWVRKDAVLAAHEESLHEHGGIAGLRDEGLLESALARAENLYRYENASIFQCSAAYAFGIAKNHPFLDGNKRTAFLAAYLFLGRNGFELNASEADAVLQTLALASGSLSENEFAAWLKANSAAIPRKRDR